MIIKNVFTSILLTVSTTSILVVNASLLSKGMSALKGLSGGGGGSQNGKCRQVVIIGPASKDDRKIANKSMF